MRSGEGKKHLGTWGARGVPMLLSQFILTLGYGSMGVHYVTFHTFSNLPEKQVYNPLSKTLRVKDTSEFRIVI